MTFRNRLREYLYLLPPILLLLVGLVGFGRAIFNVIPPITPYLMEYLKRFIVLPAIAAIAAFVWWVFLIRRDKSLLHKIFMGISIAVVVGLGISVGMWALYQRNCVANLQPLQDYYNCNFSNKDLSQSDIHGSDLTQAVLDGTDLSGANLSQADLQNQDLQRERLEGANLSGANLIGVNFWASDLSSVIAVGADFTNANLSDADLYGCSLSQAKLKNASLRGSRLFHCDLTNADLSGLDLSDTILEGADLSNANLSNADLEGADLQNIVFDEADFGDANLAGALLSNASLEGALLQGADFTEADLQGANLEQVKANDAIFARANLLGVTLDQADLSNANLDGAEVAGVDFSGVQLEGAVFVGADLSGANMSALDLRVVDLTQAILSGADLTASNFSGEEYQGLNLGGADLTGADLSRATFEDCSFVNASLSNANLNDANLGGNNFSSVNFEGASLSGTDLRASNLENADCRGLDMHTASLSGADLAGINLTGADLSGQDLSGIDFGLANLVEANFMNANLSGAILSDADINFVNFENCNLESANFSGQDLTNVEITGAYLEGVDFSSTDLRGKHLPSVHLVNANLSGAILMDVVLQNADLEDTNLSRSNLDGADLRQVNFRGSDFQEASIEGALLTYSDFYGTSGLTNEMLDSALGLVNGTFFQSRQAVINALSDVCQGTGVPDTAPYEGVLGLQPAVLLSKSGESHEWSDEIPSEWEPTGIRFTQLVVCVNPQSTYVISSTPYCLGTSYCSSPTYLQRHSYQVNVEIRRAREGTLVTSQTFYGSAPRAAKNTELWSTVKSGLWGSKVPYANIEAWLKSYIAPRSYECEDELGCVDVVPGAPIEIGAVFTLSDFWGYLGKDALRGMEIAAKDMGDILGHPIRIIEMDSECSNEVGESMAARLAENQWLIGAVGATCGGPTYSAASVLSEEGMVFISPSVSTAWLTDPEYHKAGFLRVIPNDLEQAELVAEFAYKELGARRMATIHEGLLYGEDLQIETCEVFASLGGECVVQEEMELDVTDLHGLLNRVAESSPDVIFLPVLMDSGAEILKVVQGMDAFEETSLIGTNTFFSDDFLALAGTASENHYFSGLMVGKDYYSYQYEQFLENYNTMYGTSPDGLDHAYAYDALLLLAKAIERVAVKDPDGTLHIPRQGLRDALFASRYLQGLSGTLNCTSEGDCGDPNTIRILQIIDHDPSSFNPGKEEDSNPKVVYP